MSLAGGTLSPDRSAAPSLPRSSATFGNQVVSPQPSTSSNKGKAPGQSNGNGTTLHKSTPRTQRPQKSSTLPSGPEGDETTWGSNFWVTLVDPQTQTSFFACPATGQVSWDPPVGNFVLPPSSDGEWWELSDESRGGLSYYYQTKSGETVWERPTGFVIPLGIIQNTALGRRLSQTTFNRFSKITLNEVPASTSAVRNQTLDKTPNRRSRSYASVQDTSPDQIQSQPLKSSSRASPGSSANHSPGSVKKPTTPIRRSDSNDQYHNPIYNGSSRPNHTLGQQLPPIPGSPYGTETSSPPSPSRKSITLTPLNGNAEPHLRPKDQSPNGKSSPSGRANNSDSITRARSKSSPYVSHHPPQPQSLNAAVEMLTSSQSEGGHGSIQSQLTSEMNGISNLHGHGKVTVNLPPPSTPTKEKGKRDVPPSPRRPIPAVPSAGNFWSGRSTSASTFAGKEISGPVLNHAATLDMSPVKNRATGRPIPVEPRVRPKTHHTPPTTLGSRTYPIMPQDLASDIQQFSESDYARQYFSTHRTGFIFRRRVPVAQMMTWQKPPLSSPLLTLNRSLNKDAVRVFKVIQRIMGDRERDRAVGVRIQTDNHISMVASINASTTSLAGNTVGILEEERWLLGEGLTHGELRDEIYCQIMKQVTGNPNTESVFKGWQLLCVLLITFPPSKNFETYLRSFMQQRTTQQEGRVDVMAKYGLRRLSVIAKKGPRGKPPTIAEIETASDAAFNPSTFGESLDAIIRLQERNYPHQKVPIILPFLADGILALGGTTSEGIFRVPGDGDSVSELKLRIDRGYYTLDGVDDPHVLASLLKLWLRELCDPLVPEEMYNECITNSKDPKTCVRIVERLPTINRRVVLFVVSFLQLFLEDRTQSVTKMTPANLALVMAPNLLRCNSESMSVVFTNAQYEQIFVYNLLVHLKCTEVDGNYTPTHGLGAVPTIPAARTSKSRSRRPQH